VFGNTIDRTALNELDRFHLAMDAIDRPPQIGDKGITLKQQLKNKLIEHKQYIADKGQDMPEIPKLVRGIVIRGRVTPHSGRMLTRIMFW
jgi:xylulose-5-phosphate/fructose-6-phosphate phosphoketolase